LIENVGLTDSAYVKRLTKQLQHLDAKAEAKGTPREWAAEAHQIAEHVQVKSGTDVGDAYIDTNTPKVDRQLLRGGLRLARLVDGSAMRVAGAGAGGGAAPTGTQAWYDFRFASTRGSGAPALEKMLLCSSLNSFSDGLLWTALR